MRCTDCRELLEDYFDIELAADKANEVRRHVETCASCAGELETLKSEQAFFERYRLSQEKELEGVEPQWQAVRRGISESERNRASERFARVGSREGLTWLDFLTASPLVRQAVFAVVLIGISIVGTLLLVEYRYRLKPQPTAALTLGGTAVSFEPVQTDPGAIGLEGAMRAVRKAEQEYIQAIRLLGEVVERRKPSLDPRLVREIERDMKTVDAGIAASRKAYYEQPSNPELAQFMLAAYSRKVELLQELAT